MWTKYILQKLASVNKTFTLKSTLGRQNIYYKKWHRWIKYILQKYSLAGQNVYCKNELR